MRVVHRNFTYFQKNWYILWSYDILIRLDRASLQSEDIGSYSPPLVNIQNAWKRPKRPLTRGGLYRVEKDRCTWISERPSLIESKYHNSIKYIHFCENKWNSCAPHAVLAATCTKRQNTSKWWTQLGYMWTKWTLKSYWCPNNYLMRILNTENIDTWSFCFMYSEILLIPPFRNIIR